MTGVRVLNILVTTSPSYNSSTTQMISVVTRLLLRLNFLKKKYSFCFVLKPGRTF